MCKCEIPKCRNKGAWAVQKVIVGTIELPVNPPIRGKFVTMCNKHYDETMFDVMNNQPTVSLYAEGLESIY